MQLSRGSSQQFCSAQFAQLMLIGCLLLAFTCATFGDDPIKRKYKENKKLELKLRAVADSYLLDAHYRYALHAYAKPVLNQQPTAASGDRSSERVSIPKKTEQGAQFGLIGAERLYFSKWLPSEGAALPMTAAPASATATGCHAMAEAHVTFSAAAPEVTAVPNKPGFVDVAVKGNIEVRGFAQVTPTDHCRPVAQAISVGQMRLSAYKLIPTEDGKVKGKNIARKRAGLLAGQTVFETRPDRRHKHYRTWHDPVSMTFTDDATGAILGQADLFEEECWAVGYSNITWDETDGLTLRAWNGGNCEAGISITNLSDWVENPFTGSAVLTDAGLVTSGGFDGLNWTTSTEGDWLVANLSVADFDPDYEYIINADVDATSLYNVNVDSASLGRAYAEVPEPTSAVLVLGVGAISVVRRFRNRPVRAAA